MNANSMRLLLSVTAIVTVHPSYGMDAQYVHEIDRELLIRYMQTQKDPEAIKRIIARNKTEQMFGTTVVSNAHTRPGIFKFSLYLYADDKTAHSIFDAIMQREKEKGCHQVASSYEELVNTRSSMPTNDLTDSTDYFRKYYRPYLNRLCIKCVTVFSPLQEEAVERILDAYLYEQ